MRWPWQSAAPPPERRESLGGYTEIISRLVEAQAAGTTQQASATAATEAAAGLLSRAFASAMVEGPAGIAELVNPRVLGQIGRDLICAGESCHVLRYLHGRMILLPASTWYFEGGADPMEWLCTATVYGPSGSSTWRVPFDSVIFATWGSPTARPYHGLSPQSWAADTARLNANAERTLADEAGGPVAQLIAYPEGAAGDKDDADNPFTRLREAIQKGRGQAFLVESMMGGHGQGRSEAPAKDWDANRLGPEPDQTLAALADKSFMRVLAACGCSSALFDNSDGTSKREALRQFYLATVQPLARQLEAELSAKLAATIKLRFDLYNVDLAGRAASFQKLVAGGMDMAQAAAITGVLMPDGDG